MEICPYDNQVFENNSDMLGFDWGALIGVGIQTGVGLLTNHGPTGCLVSQLKDKKKIADCGVTVMQMFDQVQAQIGLVPAAQIVASAEQVVGIFYADQYFKQSVTGDAKGVLDGLKAQARQRADAIHALVAPVIAPTPAPVQTTTVTDPTTGQTVTVPVVAPATDNTLWYLAGAALVALLVLRD